MSKPIVLPLLTLVLTALLALSGCVSSPVLPSQAPDASPHPIAALDPAAEPTPSPEPTPAPWLEETVSNASFSLQSVSETVNDRVSIFCWTPLMLENGVFFKTSALLTDLGINRVYQELSVSDLSCPETAVMVQNLSQVGVQTVFLTGDRDWQQDGLDAYYEQIDALAAYNTGIGQNDPIPGVALDVESYTTKAWRSDPEGEFAAYVDLMADAYDYAHQRGLFVVQVIPATLDTVDPELFRQFVGRCCDEVSVMNYRKDINLSSLWNEVQVCRQLGVPIETIFETMPNNEYYSVTEEKTFFYDGLDALFENQEAFRRVYGRDVGMAYHHYDCMYHLHTGGYLVHIYPYTAAGDPSRDKNGQTQNVGSILLSGDDGSLLYAYLYCPSRGGPYEEVCYLAAGVREGVRYTVTLGNPAYELSARSEDPLVFELGEKKLLSAIALHIRLKE